MRSAQALLSAGAMKETAWFILVSTALVGCGNGVDPKLEALAQSATQLDFTTTTDNGGPLDPDTPVDVTVTDPAKVSAMFQETLDLPPVEGEVLCHEEGNILFDMAFVSRTEANGVSHEVRTEMVLRPRSNCAWVTIGSSTALVTTEAYWRDLRRDARRPRGETPAVKTRRHPAWGADAFTDEARSATRARASNPARRAVDAEPRDLAITDSLCELCQIFDTLIGDGEQFYDLTSLDDQLVLGIKGTVSVVRV